MPPALPGALGLPRARFALLGLAASRAISSAGRAPPRQGGGHWFEPSIAHFLSPRPARVSAFKRRFVGPRWGHFGSRLRRSNVGRASETAYQRLRGVQARTAILGRRRTR